LLTRQEKKLLAYIMTSAVQMADYDGGGIVSALDGEKIPTEWEDEDDGWWYKAVVVLQKKLKKLKLTT
jgi:hypothetical protein